MVKVVETWIRPPSVPKPFEVPIAKDDPEELTDRNTDFL